MAQPTDATYCSCILPTGAWGTDGWHHSRYTKEQLLAKAKRDSIEVPENYAKYIGTAFAYQQCPRYLAVMKARVLQKKQAEQREVHRRKGLSAADLER